MTIAVTWERNWSTSNPAVAVYLRYATAQRRKGRNQTAETMVAWDATHGKKILPWNDAEAAAEHRLALARQFLNQFSAIVNGVRFSVFTAVPREVVTDVDGRVHAAESEELKEYFTAKQIHASPPHRQLVIQGLTGQMKTIAKKLKIWNLTGVEWAEIVQELEKVVLG